MTRIRVRIADRLVTIEESAILRALCDLSERPKAPCKRCGKPVILTPAQMGPGETIGEVGVVCATCWAPECPYNPTHHLSADAELHSYYCSACAEHYRIVPPRKS